MNKGVLLPELALPLYVMLFFICLKFQYVIKMLSDVENILNRGKIYENTVNSPKESAEKQKIGVCLKGLISKGKMYLLGGNIKWIHERVGKASDETINKAYTTYKQHELNEKGKKTGKVFCKRVISLHLSGISEPVKIRGVKKLQQDNENHPIIRDKMDNLGCFLVCFIGHKLLAPVLVVATIITGLTVNVMKVIK